MSSKSLTDKSKPPQNYIGHICKATCKTTKKAYTGKTKSHWWNHGKWRPFGYMARWGAHISEAVNNVKKCQCTYLNNAIRKYGINDWIVELLCTCPINKIDEYETKMVSEHNTLFPNGYNLTEGGDGGNLSDEACKRISTTVKQYFTNVENKQKYSKAHFNNNNKLRKDMLKSKNITVQQCDLLLKKDTTYKYVVSLHVYTVNNTKFNKNNAFSYGGKHISLSESYEMALNFAKELVSEDKISIDKNIQLKINEIQSVRNPSIAGSP
jgi:hypothetical protein